MPKITKGGVSNRLTADPDFIAEPGTPVEKAIDEGLPNVGKPDSDTGDSDTKPGIDPDKHADNNRVTRAQEPEKPDTPVDAGNASAKTAAPARKAQGQAHKR